MNESLLLLNNVSMSQSSINSIFNSRATRHMFNNLAHLSDYVPNTGEEMQVEVAQGQQILSHLQLRGTFYSDCQGLDQKLKQRRLLRRNTTSLGCRLLHDCVRLISESRSIRWIKGHPERPKISCSD